MLLGASRGLAEPSRPNIVFIMIDDQKRAQANYLPEGRDESGDPRNLTPNIDRLASEGVVLPNAYATSPLCAPSRFACLTGNYASRARNEWSIEQFENHGYALVDQFTEITPETATLPKDLRRAGYATGAVGKNHVIEVKDWVLPKASWDPRNLEVRTKLKDNYERVIEAYRQVGFDYADGIYHENPDRNGPPGLKTHNLDWVTEKALEFIEANAASPFYLYYASTVPHGPGPERGWKSDPKATPLGFLEEAAPGVLPPRESIAQRLAEAGLDDRAGQMVWLDDAIGAIYDKLEEEGVLDNTVIFYFNDHGTESGKLSLYQGGFRSFGWVWAKDWAKLSRVEERLCSNVDWAPTIAELAGYEPEPGRYDGVSLLPLIRRGQPVRDLVYGEIGHTRAVFDGRWKYLAYRPSQYHQNMSFEERTALLDSKIATMESAGILEERPWILDNKPMESFFHGGVIPGGWQMEQTARKQYPTYFDNDQLFDLRADPNEQRNLAYKPGYAYELSRLKELLRRSLSATPGQFGEF